jgi:2-dehydro-3-deoxyphosphogluconate aldolase/(4S)-4-hydroxy-2-oxoglutarate aldolase
MNIEDFSRVTIIIRGFEYKQIRSIVDVLSRSKVNSVEIALNNIDSKNILEKITKEYRDKMIIGAGTVLNKEDLLDVINIGVNFVLSPIMFSQDMFQICKENNVISVPGAYSPDEIYKSFQNGADIVKVFPASTVTPRFFKDIKAPLGEMKLMAVGGVNSKNASEYIKNGANFLGIGSGIFNKQDIIDNNFKQLEQSIRVLEENIKNL